MYRPVRSKITAAVDFMVSSVARWKVLDRKKFEY
jgi:hypothetical protein